jgi:hypothetical protein
MTRKVVMRGLDPRIHLLCKELVAKRMDCRIKSGNDRTFKHDQYSGEAT